ncbi:MAG: hypothetical protein RR324_02945 [Cellulosilyticaceae bacterium]
MLLAHSHFIPFDLLSNFLTRTYLDTLEALYHHSDYQLDSPNASLETIKSLKSFLFIFQNNNRNIEILQKQVFDCFTPYTYLSKTEILKQELDIYPDATKSFCVSKRSFTIPTLRKIYAKNILSIKKQSSYEFWANYNIVFIHMHRNLVYHRFHEESSLPKILTASTATDFIVFVWEYYLDHLVTMHNFEYILETINMLSNSLLPQADYLINYLKNKLYLIEYSSELDVLLKQLS